MANAIECELKRRLEASYGLTNLEVSLIRVGGDGNQTYRIMAGQALLIARVYGEEGRKNPDWVRYELELISHLVKGGVRAAEPLAARDGAYTQHLTANNDEMAPVAVFTFAEGGVEWPTSISRSFFLGAAFAQLHLVGSSFRTSIRNLAGQFRRFPIVG